MTTLPPIRVLLVEDSPTDAFLLKEELRNVPGAEFVTTQAERLEDALAQLSKRPFEVVLLDLGLPDSQGADTLIRLRQHEPQVPMVVLTGLSDEEVGTRALQLGAQDYLIKGQYPAQLLGRSLRHAIERHSTALALRQSEARLSGLVSSAIDAIVSVDDRQHITLFNPAAEQTFGYGAKDIIGQTLDRLVPKRFRQVQGEELRLFGQIDAEHSKTGRMEVIYGLRADGTEFPMEVSVSQVDVAGQKLVTSILRDITERRRAEAALHLRTEALQAAANGVVITDKDGTIVWANAAVAALTGYPVDELMGKNPRILKSGKHGQPFYRELWATILGGQVWHGEMVNRRKDGSLYTEEMTIAPVRDESGEVSRFIAIKQDVTERRRAQDEIHKLNTELDERVRVRTAELEAAYKEMEGFNYSIAHDLRAPLRAINGLCAMLSEDYAPLLEGDARGLIEKVQGGATRMSNMVDGLLRLSRIGLQALNQSTTALGPIVIEVVRELELDLRGREIEWQIGNLPSVECDPDLIRQVFTNLLSNATKYTRRRERAVIAVGQSDDAPVFFVRDNGVGFDVKYSEKLFGVFHRLHRDSEFEGTGIGLAIVQRIVQRHDGCVWAEAEVNNGATFYFTLGGASARRQSERHKLHKPVTLRVQKPPKDIYTDVITVNVSAEGARVHGDIDVRPGQVLDLIVIRDPPQVVPARVVWVKQAAAGCTEVGMRFARATDLPQFLLADAMPALKSDA